MGEKSGYINVLVVSAYSLVREGIISMLSGADDIKVVGRASNRLELMECIYKLKPNIVIINDEDNKSVSSLEAVQLINQESNDAKVLLLIEDYDKDKELAALEMGVRGYLPERARKADFAKCIKAINRGEMWVRREIMGEFVKQLFVKIKRGDYLSPSVPYFTKRELEIITLACKGYRNKEIAIRLFLSEKTVKHHLSKIFKKLNIKKRADIKKYFFGEG
jgi:DNA-binding NarL/FixJ family response regulator